MERIPEPGRQEPKTPSGHLDFDTCTLDAASQPWTQIEDIRKLTLVKRGNIAPNADLKTVLAARTLAA